jgi:hypothetical protein
VLCLFVYSGVQHILCCVCLCIMVSNTYCVVFCFVCLRLVVYPMLSVSLDCFCFVCLRLVSCVPYVVSFSGLYIVDCPFGILYIKDVAQMFLIQNKFSKKIKWVPYFSKFTWNPQKSILYLYRFSLYWRQWLTNMIIVIT